MLRSSETLDSGVKVGSRLLKRYVLRGEQVEVATRQHLAVLIEPVSTVLVGFFIVSWITIQLDRMFGNAGGYLWVLWLLLVGRLIWKVLEWRNEWFVATDKRLLLTYGLISHKVAMMPLGKVTDMTYNRPILGRFLHYGTFLMESAGKDQALQKIRWVPNPDQTYREICQIIFDPGSYDSEDSLPENESTQRSRDKRQHEDEGRYEDDGGHEDNGGHNKDDEHQNDREHEQDGRYDDGDESDDETFEDDQPEDDEDWSGDHSSPAPPENAGWQTSREGASTYQRVTPRKKAHDNDEDTTGPIPRTKKES